MLRTVSNATTVDEKEAAVNKLGISPENHGRYVRRYRQLLATNAAASKKNKRAITAKRLSGGGRRPLLAAEQEEELRQWWLQLRRGPARLAVSEVMVQFEAKRRWKIPATNKWVQGWMQRNRLTVRQRTTHKEINTERMMEVKQHHINKHANLFNTTSHHHIFNTDETSVYLDSPDNRTIEEIGARSVEIGHTEHYADRVSVVLCVSASGRLLPPLVVHMCDEKVRFEKTGKYTLDVYKTSKHAPEVPAVAMCAGHGRTRKLSEQMFML